MTPVGESVGKTASDIAVNKDGLMNIVVNESSAKGTELDRVAAFGNNSIVTAIEKAETKLELYNLLCEFHETIGNDRFIFVLSDAGKAAAAKPRIITNWPATLLEFATHSGLINNLTNAGAEAVLGSNLCSSCLEISSALQLVNADTRTPEFIKSVAACKLDTVQGFVVSLGAKTESRLIGLIEGNPFESMEERTVAEVFYSTVGNRMLSFAAQESAGFPVLSKRETECIRWTAEGKTSYEIGIILGLSENTINNYIASVTKKMGAVNRSHMISLAFRNGIIS